MRSNADLPSTAVATTSNSAASNEVSSRKNAELSSATMIRSLAKAVEFVVVMPREITLAEPVRVRCHGHVQRTEMRSPNRVGIAAEIESYEFLRAATAAP